MRSISRTIPPLLLNIAAAGGWSYVGKAQRMATVVSPVGGNASVIGREDEDVGVDTRGIFRIG